MYVYINCASVLQVLEMNSGNESFKAFTDCFTEILNYSSDAIQCTVNFRGGGDI